MAQPLKNKRILISGASIAGPALAYWLNAYGFDVTIVERHPALRPGGYGVDIRGVAIQVIEKMNILSEVKAADTHMQATRYLDTKGVSKGTMNEAALGSGSNDIEIMRDDLATILYNVTQPNVTYIWGDAITSLADHTSGIDVTFGKHKPQTFDLVIGADGIHSGVRRLTFGDERKFLKPLGCYISIITLDNYLKIDHEQLFYTAPGRTVGMYSARNNTEAKAMHLFASPRLDYDYHDTEAQKKLVHNAFANQHGWETQTLLKKMEKAPDFYFDEVSQVHMPKWSRGRVALVGDAGYCPSPLSGQGSSLALVGAYVLAGELKEHSVDFSAAFSAYETQLRPFIEKNQRIGEMTAGSMIEKSNFKIALRTLTLRIPGFMTMMFKFITKMIAKAANAIELKSYK